MSWNFVRISMFWNLLIFYGTSVSLNHVTPSQILKSVVWYERARYIEFKDWKQDNDTRTRQWSPALLTSWRWFVTRYTGDWNPIKIDQGFPATSTRSLVPLTIVFPSRFEARIVEARSKFRSTRSVYRVHRRIEWNDH